MAMPFSVIPLQLLNHPAGTRSEEESDQAVHSPAHLEGGVLDSPCVATGMPG